MPLNYSGRSPVTYIFALALVSITIIWVFLGLYQSHYIIGLQMLGDLTTHNVLGVPKGGRGDEWSTYIPMLKQAYLEGFPAKSNLEPYRENLDWFIAIPKWDASLFFLPHQLLFWVFPGRALSLEGVYYNVLLLASVYWFLRNVSVKPGLAVAAAVFILFSHFYQVWWTSNFPALGASLLPYAVLTSKIRRDIKYPLLFWSLGQMLFGQIYPPFYLSVAVAVLPIIAVLQPTSLQLRNLVMAGIAAILALAVFVLLRYDFIRSVAATTYPGLRHETGGGGTFFLLLSTVFPTIPTGLPDKPVDTLHEMSVVSSIFPILYIAIIPQIRWDRQAILLTVAAAFVTIFMGIYITLGFPSWLADLTGFYMVPGRRMLIGFSVLILFYTAIMVSENWEAFRWWNILTAILIFTIFSYFLGMRTDASDAFKYYNWYVFAPAVLTGLGAVIWLAFRPRIPYGSISVGLLLLGLCSLHVVVYGSFNPLMKARDILTPVNSQFTRDIKELVKFNGGKPVAIYGNYGDLLRGENLPALNAIHLANVESKIYTEVLGVSGAHLERLFNRFRGIMFDNVGKIEDEGSTAAFPLSDFAVSFQHQTAKSEDRSENLLAGEPLVTANVENGRTAIYWKSFISKPLPVDQALKLSFSCDVKSSWMTRYPVVLPGQPLVDVALQGVAGKLVVNDADVSASEACVRSMGISSMSRGK